MIDLADRFTGNCACRDTTTGEIHYHGVKFWIKEGSAGFRVCDGDGGHVITCAFDDPAAVEVFVKFISALRECHALKCGERADIAS